MSKTTHRTASARRGFAAMRLVSGMLVVIGLAGMVNAGGLISAQPAAAGETSSQLTVKWSGDSSPASKYQPARGTTSAHFSEFKNISISVFQTTGIIDQAVRVSVTGFAGTRSSTTSGIEATNAKNYLQAMQCWGDDPLASDFNQTCEWGGRYLTENNGLGNSVITDNAARVGPLDVDTARPTTHDVPFRTFGGTTVSGKPYLDKSGTKQYDILNYFGPQTTNEVTSARIGTNGAGYFDFETQSSYQAPHLGCGTGTHLRCWLVVVPRGTVFGGDGEKCSGILDPANGYDPYTKGRPNSVQGGSPVNDQCDYWNNRIVVPLDFVQTGNTCPVGSAEVQVIGSQLMVGAMASWQPSLCKTVKNTFSFATNTDSIARAQLIETGPKSPNIAFSGYPVSSGELQTDEERQVLADTTLAYAPVAISGVSIAFFAEFDGGRQEKLNLSPRLVAKLLTQSYRFTVPSNSSDPSRNFAHLGAVNRTYNYLNQDPDFRALNPENWNEFTANPAIVLPGPGGADAIRQVWRWILADKDAVAFLDGTVDPWGMTVNPYYLPAKNPAAVVPWFLDDQKAFTETPTSREVGLRNLDGSPQRLASVVLDTFPKNDESLVPLKILTVAQGGAGEKSRFDSIQYAPYTDNLLSGALQAFRAIPNSKTVWDGTKLNAAGDAGDWVSSGAQLPGAKFMIAVTDSPSAGRYGLNTAGIQVPNSSSIVNADTAGMTKALSALEPTTVPSIKQIDPAKVGLDGYPLTMITYAGVNLSKATADARKVIAQMLTQVTSTGQVSGTATGELPAGYLPLTAELVAQADSAAKSIAEYVAPETPAQAPATSRPVGSGSVAQDEFTTGATDIEALATAAPDPVVAPGQDAIQAGRTEITPTDGFARNGIALSMGVGLAGLLFAPILFRGRGSR